MAEMSTLLEVEKLYNVYNKLTLENDELSGPSGRKQIYDKKYNDRKRERQEEFGRDVNRRSIADHISEIDRMAAEGNTIVKSRTRGKRLASFFKTTNKFRI